MKIEEYIRTEVLLPRLHKVQVMVVYDPDQRYRDLCHALASPRLRVVDAAESSILSREAALATLREIGGAVVNVEELLVYVPTTAPTTDDDKQADPFALYAACGAMFPDGDGDTYLSLCLRAKPNNAAQLRDLFNANPNPSFAAVDAVDNATTWPQLQALLRTESARSLIGALLAPTEAQQRTLKEYEGWVAEARELLLSTLGLRLITRGKTWSLIADELWRYLLFSEFVFDLPEALPDVLDKVPRAPAEARPLIEDLCDRLRNDRRTQARYIEQAERVEQELRLPEACRAIRGLGIQDTFPFEERSFFSQAVHALLTDKIDTLHAILARRGQSVWMGRGENQSQWQLLQAAASLINACEDADRQLRDNTRTQQNLIDFYLSSLCQVDCLQRECEQIAGDQGNFSLDGNIGEVLNRARRTYRRLMDNVQAIFLKHLGTSGWPPANRLANADVFDRVVLPLLQRSGQRIALFFIDALRYELGVELHKQLAGDYPADLQPAFAALPSVTRVGMASLLPGAGQQLNLTRSDAGVVPNLGTQTVNNVTQRMNVLRQHYGQRFHEVGLLDFVRSKPELPDTVELLVIRSNEMDNDFESNTEAALGLVVRTFQQIQAAIHKLRMLGFRNAVVVSDHGFYLNTVNDPGDKCTPPQGEWIKEHDRFLLGKVAADNGTWALPAEALGIRGDFVKAAGPRAMVAYQVGRVYLHGGASLQETVVPVLNVQLQSAEAEGAKVPTVKLRYTRVSQRITTRVPVVEVAVSSTDLFSMDTPVDILLEAHDKRGNVVGEAKPGGPVNPATLLVSLQPGSTAQITLKMHMDFEGKFSVKALDPATRTTYDKLDLETDYTV